MEKKYEIMKDHNIEINGHVLYRIRALRDFGIVKKGDVGGYIEQYENLSQEGECWVYDDAIVFNNARVKHNARIKNSARISGGSLIYDNAYIWSNASIKCRSFVHDDAEIYGSAEVTEDAEVCGNAKISGNAHVGGEIIIRDSARIFDDAIIRGNCFVIDGKAEISNDALIRSNFDYYTLYGFGPNVRSSYCYDDHATFFKCSDGSIKVNCGFYDFHNGTLTSLRDKLIEMKNNNNNKRMKSYAKEYLLIIKLIEKDCRNRLY